MSELRALTLVQPWASLIMCGAKTLETRSWLPAAKWMGDGGLTFLVHAGAKVDYGAVDTTPITRALADAGIGRDAIPTGVVLGVAHVYRAAAHRPGDLDDSEIQEQQAFGWFGPGRCYWFLSTVASSDVLPKPIPAKGMLGLWRPSNELVTDVHEQLPDCVWLR